MSHEGIFRISGNYKVVESLKALYDKGMLCLMLVVSFRNYFIKEK